MVDVRIEKYEDAHGEFIARNMRPSDKREMYYLAAFNPQSAIKATIASAVQSFTAIVDDEPILMWGVSRRSFLSDVGVPWLLGTPTAEQYQYRFGRRTLDYFKEMTSQFEVLENYALAENKRSLRWLKWTGFDIEEPKPFGIFNVPFVRFGKGLTCA